MAIPGRYGLAKLPVAEAAVALRQSGADFQAEIVQRHFFAHVDLFALSLTLGFFGRACDVDCHLGFDLGMKLHGKDMQADRLDGVASTT